MNVRNILSLALVALLLAAPALAQQPQAHATQAATSAKAKADAKAKKPKDPHNLGKLHDGAKARGVDTSNPESLKGKNVDAELMKNFKL